MTQSALQNSVLNPSSSATDAACLPNFSYIGTSKAGSTWIYSVLAKHPQVFMAPAKGAYFFDSHFHEGLDWYRNHFRGASGEAVVGEISHSYLYSRHAADRIQQIIPNAKLLVCVRNPVERAFSAYLDAVKNGLFCGTFAEAIRENPSLKQRGEYATQLEMYFQRFSRSQIHVAVFDDLKVNPQRFADDLFEFLSLPGYELTATMQQKMMPAARPRSRRLTQFAKRIARSCERLGWGGLRGRAKRSRLVRDLLYRPYADGELPTMDSETQQQLKEYFRDEVLHLDKLLGTSLAQKWNIV